MGVKTQEKRAVARANLQHVVRDVTLKLQKLATQRQRFLPSLNTYSAAPNGWQPHIQKSIVINILINLLINLLINRYAVNCWI